jgi:hypothetical protein
LPDKSTKTWERIRSENRVNEKSVAAYRRVIAAEEVVADTCYRRGISHAAITQALAASESETSEIENEHDLLREPDYKLPDPTLPA